MKRYINCLSLVILLFICSIGTVQASQSKLLNTTTDTEIVSADITTLKGHGICSFTKIRLGEHINLNNCVFLLGEAVSVDGYPKFSIGTTGVEFKNGYILLKDYKVSRIRILNANAVADGHSIVTVRGIGVGSKIDFLLKQYGQPSSIRDLLVSKIYRYENSSNYIEFDVDMDSKKISNIEIGFVNTSL